MRRRWTRIRFVPLSFGLLVFSQDVFSELYLSQVCLSLLGFIQDCLRQRDFSQLLWAGRRLCALGGLQSMRCAEAEQDNAEQNMHSECNATRMRAFRYLRLHTDATECCCDQHSCRARMAVCSCDQHACSHPGCAVCDACRKRTASCSGGRWRVTQGCSLCRAKRATRSRRRRAEARASARRQVPSPLRC